MKALVIYSILLVLFPLGLSAQDQFTASVDKSTIGENERFTYTVSVQGTGFGEVKMPQFNEFTVLGGPSQSSNQSYEIINGSAKISIRKSISYVLKPSRLGTFTIGPAHVAKDGKTFTSNSVQIKVTKAQQSTNPNLMARIEVSKRNVYVGEAFMVTYVIYNRYRNIQLSEFDLPQNASFISEEIEVKSVSWDKELKVVDGIQYQRAVLKKEVLFPQQFGDIEIPAFSINAHAGGGFFSMGTEINVTSNPAKIKIKPLPKGKPVNFSGGVGEFSIEIKTDTQDVKTNDAIDFELTISGTGNLKYLDKPAIQFPPDFETYDPKLKNKYSLRSNGHSGKRTYHYVIIPRHAGEYKIPSQTFSYFDIRAEKYKTINTPSYVFNIEKGEGDENISTYIPSKKEDVKVLGSGIRYIKPTENIIAKNQFWFGTTTYYTGLLTPALGFILLLIIRNKTEASKKDIVSAKMKKASKIASKRLSTAKSFLRENKELEFFEELSKALQNYLSDKFNLDTANLNASNIATQLEKKGVDTATIANLQKTIELCEMARFSPVMDTPSNDVYQEAANIIHKIENSVR